MNRFTLLAMALCVVAGRITGRADDHGDSMGSATSLGPNSSISGTIDYGGDEDYFRVQVSAGGTLSAYTTGGTDTYGYLLDSGGGTLSSSDDDPFPNFHVTASVSPGTYYIRVRHYSGAGTGGYTLNTSFSAASSGGGGDGNSSVSSATYLSLGGSVSSAIDYAGDEDYFRLDVSSPGTLTAYTTGSTDTYGYLLNSNEVTLIANDDNPYPNFLFSYSVSVGIYYIRLRHYFSSDTGGYTLFTSFSSGGGGGGGGSTVSLAEALDNSSLSWTTGGSSSWTGQTGTYFSGGDSAQSSWISDNGSTYLETTVTGPGTLSFVWKVSSEGGCDFLRFSIDGLLQTSIAGEVGWTSLSYNLSSGSHTLRWSYSTDVSTLSGSNAGWVDYVQFTPTAPSPPPVSVTPDLVLRHRGTGLNSLWFMNNNVLEQSQPILPDLVPDLDWEIVGTGDFNGDGQRDLVWQHRTTRVIGVWFMNGRAMSSTALTNPDRVGDLNWRIVGVADFNRDNKPDLLWQHESTGEVAIWHMDGVNLVGATLTNPSAPNDWNWKLMDVGDFNQDGYPDLLWEHQSWGQVAIWYMNDATYLSSTLTYPSGVDDLSWKITGTGDFNRDGRTDITWQHAVTGMISVWYMNGSSWISPAVFSPAYPESASWTVQAVGDFQSVNVDSDNDLMPDAWELQHFGNLSQSASGDYDGDGVSNLQEFRNGTNPAVPSVTIKMARPRIGSGVP